MAYIKFHRGSHQIGGSCTELCCGNERILIDLGSNLPGTDEESPISDKELIKTVFDGETKYSAILFTHYHGDHYGLYKNIPRDIPIYSDIPMYIGKTAKDILGIVTEYIDINAEIKGKELIDSLKTYTPDQPLKIRDIKNIKIIPIQADHSALDAYMFYIEMAGKRILYTGDFRTHGISSEQDVFWDYIKSGVIPSEIDILITEGTMLSREEEARKNTINTEDDLGKAAAGAFTERPYNFVMVSSTNLDSVMEFYHNTPDNLRFVCDIYQYSVMCKAMQGKGDHNEKYRPRKDNITNKVHVLFEKYNDKIGRIIDDNKKKGLKLYATRVAPDHEYEEIKDGFVMLVRPNHYPKTGKNRFEKAIDHFSNLDESKVQIIYSMWEGYLEGKDKEDPAITAFLGSHKRKTLHVSGHAYSQDIHRLIQALNPKVIVPMHTEMADEMQKMDMFKDFNIKTLRDEENILDLDDMEVR
ncbi:MAG: hypothetical protein K6G03_04290 [Lachnospiraceae bacterium]|nr:hypothetical protein [Lachnospiraceae bacterium]